MEPKHLKFICKNCGHIVEKKVSHKYNITTEKCPECNKMTFELHNPNYLERMKDVSNV
jgi:rubrerythrin